MRVSQAISLCTSLTLLEPDPAHYRAATREILEVLEGVSPIVQPGEDGLPGRGGGSFAGSAAAGAGGTSSEGGVFHVGVDGLDRLYGPPRAQVDRVLYALLEILPPPLVAAVRAGWAPGLFGAWVAAASARPGSPVLVAEEGLVSFLAPCPISVLRLPDEMRERLERLDVNTLEALGELPASALLRQFGKLGEEARALARGERIDPVRPLHRPRPIRVTLDFPAPVGERESLQRGLERLLERGLARPERRDRSVRGIRAGGRLEDGGSWEVEATLREPSARREVLAFSLRNRASLFPPPRALESLFVELFDFGTPVLQSDLFQRKEEGGRPVGGTSLAAGRISRTLKEAVRELTLRLGHSPLYRVVEVDPWSRIPERRHALLGLEP